MAAPRPTEALLAAMAVAPAVTPVEATEASQAMATEPTKLPAKTTSQLRTRSAKEARPAATAAEMSAKLPVSSSPPPPRTMSRPIGKPKTPIRARWAPGCTALSWGTEPPTLTARKAPSAMCAPLRKERVNSLSVGVAALLAPRATHESYTPAGPGRGPATSPPDGTVAVKRQDEAPERRSCCEKGPCWLSASQATRRSVQHDSNTALVSILITTRVWWTPNLDAAKFNSKAAMLEAQLSCLFGLPYCATVISGVESKISVACFGHFTFRQYCFSLWADSFLRPSEQRGDTRGLTFCCFAANSTRKSGAGDAHKCL